MEGVKVPSLTICSQMPNMACLRLLGEAGRGVLAALLFMPQLGLRLVQATLVLLA